MSNAKKLQKRILEEIESGEFATASRLPRELVLAERMGVSRTQLRDVLIEIEREGFITRIHGFGTVINRHVLQVKSRMDIEVEFLDIIQKNGYEPSIMWIEIEETTACKHIANKLAIQEGDKIVRIRLVCGADGRPAIYSEDVLAEKIVKKDYKKEKYQGIVFDFLERFCNRKTYMDLTEIHPAIADEKLADILEVPIGTLLLNMEEVNYDVKGEVLFYSRQYFVDGLIKHTVFRKRL